MTRTGGFLQKNLQSEKKIQKDVEPESEEIESTTQIPAMSENQIDSKVNETAENIPETNETVPNAQSYIETKTLRPTISSDRTSPDPGSKISVKDIGINMTKRSKFDQRQFARLLFVDETYKSSMVQPSITSIYRFYTCILLFIVM